MISPTASTSSLVWNGFCNTRKPRVRAASSQSGAEVRYKNRHKTIQPRKRMRAIGNQQFHLRIALFHQVLRLLRIGHQNLAPFPSQDALHQTADGGILNDHDYSGL